MVVKCLFYVFFFFFFFLFFFFFFVFFVFFVLQIFKNINRVEIYCDANPPVTLKYTSGYVFVRFYSDGNTNGEGFNATYTMRYGNTFTNGYCTEVVVL